MKQGVLKRLTQKLTFWDYASVYATVGYERPDPSHPEIPDQVGLAIWLINELEKINLLNDEQRWRVLVALKPLLADAACGGTGQVCFIDNEYLVFTGQTGFLDLFTGLIVEKLRSPPLRMITYDLRVTLQAINAIEA